jgi:hypothetical protein
MYTNIGDKIKHIAQIVAIAGIVGSVLSGLVLISQGLEVNTNGNSMVGLGLGVLIAGSLLSWVLSLFLYGFGELIVNTAEIVKNTSINNATSPLLNKPQTMSYNTNKVQNADNPSTQDRCLCTEIIDLTMDTCQKCGRPIEVVLNLLKK